MLVGGCGCRTVHMQDAEQYLDVADGVGRHLRMSVGASDGVGRFRSVSVGVGR